MNRSGIVTVAVAAAIALSAVIGAFAVFGSLPNDGQAATPIDTATPAPADQSDATTDQGDQADETAAPDGTSLSYNGSSVTLRNDPGQAVTGTTDLDAGTTLTVRLLNGNGSQPFIRQTTTTVGDDGQFTATVDLSAIEVGTTFEVSVRHDGQNLTAAPGEVVEGTVDESDADDESAEIEYDGDALTLENDPDQTVSGTTDLEAGAEIQVRLLSTNGSSPFIKSVETTVSANGDFEVTVDMSGIPAGMAFNVAVRHDGTELASAPGVVTEGTEVESDGSDSADDEANVLSYEGEAVSLQNASGQVVSGTTDLASGTEVTVQLRSSNGDQPFVKQFQTTVGADGAFEATFNMSTIDPGPEFTVTVRVDGDTIDDAPGVVTNDEK